MVLGGQSDDEVPPAVFDLANTPDWARLSDELRRRIVSVAARYLSAKASSPFPAEWPVGYPTDPALVPVRAMAVLRHFPEYQATLADAVWKRYGSLALWYPTRNDDRISRRELVCTAYRCAPDAMVDALAQRLRLESPVGLPGILTLFDGCWDDRITSTLDQVARETQEPERLTELLVGLLARRYRPVVSLLRELGEHAEAPLRSAGALALATARPRVGGRLLAAWVRADDALGKAVLKTLVRNEMQTSLLVGMLPPDVIAELFLWLAMGPVPFRTDSGYPEHDSRTSLRDGLMRMVVERGAVAEVRRIADIMHDAPGLRLYVGPARKNSRRMAWKAPAPADVLRLTKDRRRRLVRDADDLLKVVVEVLDNLQSDLSGETPMAYLLWDNVPRKAPRKDSKKTNTPDAKPKDEESLSDFLKFYLSLLLERRGIVLNREVQIRRGGDGWSGELLDLRIDAVTAGGDVVSVIVEVKGSWHAEWETAMETQLVDRYLRKNRVQHGIYLVGWFEDGRQAGGKPLEEVRKTLSKQAKGLTGDGQHIQAVVLDFSLN
jgi:hypothetical protein